MKHIAVPAFALASLLCAPAMAIDAAKDAFLLWSAVGEGQDRDAKAFFNLDYDPATPGIETLGLAQSCTISAADANNKISATYRISYKIKDATGFSTLFETPRTQPSSVTSLRFPDPNVARFQCGGANQTRFELDGEGDNLGVPDPLPTVQPNCNFFPTPFNGNIASALCEQLPQLLNIGLGIATKGATRYFVVGNAARGAYQNNVDGEVDFSRFNISTYDSTGARVMTRTLGASDAFGFELAWQFGSVGDYLDNGTDVDEIRLVYAGGGETSFRLKYVYYDVATGAQIEPAVTVTTPCPGPCLDN